MKTKLLLSFSISLYFIATMALLTQVINYHPHSADAVGTAEDSLQLVQTQEPQSTH